MPACGGDGECSIPLARGEFSPDYVMALLLAVPDAKDDDFSEVTGLDLGVAVRRLKAKKNSVS